MSYQNTDNGYAIKTIPHFLIETIPYDIILPIFLLNLKEEFQSKMPIQDVQTSLKHPYIIRLQDKFFEFTALHFLIKYTSGGDLFERIKLTDTVTRRLMRCIETRKHFAIE